MHVIFRIFIYVFFLKRSRLCWPFVTLRLLLPTLTGCRKWLSRWGNMKGEYVWRHSESLCRTTWSDGHLFCWYTCEFFTYVCTFCVSRFEAKRIVVRQGHPGSSYYFMLSGAGELLLYITESLNCKCLK